MEDAFLRRASSRWVGFWLLTAFDQIWLIRLVTIIPTNLLEPMTFPSWLAGEGFIAAGFAAAVAISPETGVRDQSRLVLPMMRSCDIWFAFRSVYWFLEIGRCFLPHPPMG